MIEQNKKYKIALIGYRLSAGGSDRVMARLSIFFENHGIEVHNLIVIDEVSYPFSGKLVNLGLLKNNSNGLFNKFQRMKALRTYLRANTFDFIIDFRFRTKPLQELLLSRVIYNTKTIFTVHSYLIDHYMPNATWLTRLMYNHCYANVVLTQQMRTLVEQKHHLKNLVTIYNPVDVVEIDRQKDETIALNFEYIIAVGQYENGIKQFDQLIKSYSRSILPERNIHLVILGDGDKSLLTAAIHQNKMEDKVLLAGYRDNPFKYIAKAKFLVLSSKNEGLPNVIIEALACKTPVVSFRCPSGPEEVIQHGYNGVLVDDQQFDKLTEAMDTMVTDEYLYQTCKSNSRSSIVPFLLETVGQQWLELMKLNSHA